MSIVFPSSISGVRFKNYIPGDTLTAAELIIYAMNQMVLSFSDSSQRDTALSAILEEGMTCYLVDTSTLQYYDGTIWQAIAQSTDLAAVDSRSTLLKIGMS